MVSFTVPTHGIQVSKSKGFEIPGEDLVFCDRHVHCGPSEREWDTLNRDSLIIKFFYDYETDDDTDTHDLTKQSLDTTEIMSVIEGGCRYFDTVRLNNRTFIPF